MKKVLVKEDLDEGVERRSVSFPCYDQLAKKLERRFK